LVLPGSVVKELAFPAIQKQTVKYANEETDERDVVRGVEVTISDRKAFHQWGSSISGRKIF
jgi:hypothetical protein